MVNFVDENQIDFNNLETYLASTLITDEDFIIAIPKSDQVMPFQMCGIIGDIAGIASLSCFLVQLQPPSAYLRPELLPHAPSREYSAESLIRRSIYACLADCPGIDGHCRDNLDNYRTSAQTA